MHSTLISTFSPAVRFHYILCWSFHSITNARYHRWSLDRLYQKDRGVHRIILT